MEFILAGASAIQVGTYNFVNPAVTMEIIDYMHDYCAKQGVDNISDLIGALNV
jgi:dihydroorotate dehydrogenase (NAD+) catalytic subunit